MDQMVIFGSTAQIHLCDINATPGPRYPALQFTDCKPSGLCHLICKVDKMLYEPLGLLRGLNESVHRKYPVHSKCLVTVSYHDTIYEFKNGRGGL